MLNPLRILLAMCCLWVIVPTQAQVREELLSEVLATEPGPSRVKRLIERARQERAQGRYREAIQFAIHASSEAERNEMNAELGKALMELAEAHYAKGDLDNAIGASIRATMVNGNYHNTLRTQALLQLADLYLKAGHPQKALEHLYDAESTTAADRMDRGRFLRSELKAKNMVLAPASMIKFCEQRRDEVVRSGDRELQLQFFSMLATAQAREGMNMQALASEEQVMRLAIALDRPLEAGICANNMGELNHRLKRNEEALLAYGRGLIMVEDDPMLKISMMMNAAHAHAMNGNAGISDRMIQEALHEVTKARNDRLLPRLLRTRSAIHMLQGDLAAAQNAALDALAAAEKRQDRAEQQAACDMLASIFDQRDLTAESLVYFKKARDLELQLSMATTQAKTDRETHLLRLQRIEREQVDVLNRENRKESRLKQLATDAENREKQMELLTYEKQLEESARREAMAAREQADKDLQLAQAALEAERQERMIQDLDNSRMLQSLNFTKLKLEQKEQQQAMDLLAKRNELVEAQSRTLEAQQKHDVMLKRFYIGLAAAAVLLSLYMAWAWNVSRKKRRTIMRQNEQIQGINAELAEKNHNIQSSIGYAHTIQSAILPTEADLQGAMPESFLLYKPLDTVSGDLPFMKRVGDRLFVAAIDCTGHGVPAAMMTFIAYYGLSDLLTQYADESCGAILDRLHDHVKRTMDARGDENLYNDGFDIGFCCIDLGTGQLSFAGAQLPLLLVRGEEVTRIKGDILPLGDGHFVRKKGYKDHHMQLQKGDALFLFSDGIIHQFGGPDGTKKFSLRRLTELQKETSAQDLCKVKEQTEELFLEWKGDTPQTDDVLMIGLRYAA